MEPHRPASVPTVGNVIDAADNNTGTTSPGRVHAFRDDALGYDDATALVERIRRREVSPDEVLEAAIARCEAVDPTLGALAFTDFEGARARARTDRDALASAPLAGLPTAFKDNVRVGGAPMTMGSPAVPATPSDADSPHVRALRATGLNPLGTTAMPPFGWTAATERQGGLITRNPWNTGRTSGGSSGGASALVASGALPIAHANDGGGSIRIPAAVTGLVGFKPSRGRHPDEVFSRSMPIPLISQGVVTRSVRDTVAFVSAFESAHPPVGLKPLTGAPPEPGRRLRIGLVEESPAGGPPDAATSAALRQTADRLAELGHEIIPTTAPVPASFRDDFIAYWSLLAMSTAGSGKKLFHPDFDPDLLDPFTVGLSRRAKRRLHTLPLHLLRLERVRRQFDSKFGDVDVYLNPVVAAETPEVGYLGADLPFETHLEHVSRWVTFTPLQNVTGSPAISLPTGQAPDGMPIGMHLSSRRGEDRLLLELAAQYEAAFPFARIWE